MKLQMLLERLNTEDAAPDPARYLHLLADVVQALAGEHATLAQRLVAPQPPLGSCAQAAHSGEFHEHKPDCIGWREAGTMRLGMDLSAAHPDLLTEQGLRNALEQARETQQHSTRVLDEARSDAPDSGISWQAQAVRRQFSEAFQRAGYLAPMGAQAREKERDEARRDREQLAESHRLQEEALQLAYDDLESARDALGIDKGARPVHGFGQAIRNLRSALLAERDDAVAQRDVAKETARREHDRAEKAGTEKVEAEHALVEAKQHMENLRLQRDDLAKRLANVRDALDGRPRP